MDLLLEMLRIEGEASLARLLRSGLSRVYPGRPGSGSTEFLRANSQAGFYLDPDRFQARVGRVPGQPAGPVRVSKLWII